MAQINKPSDYFNTVLYTGNNTTNAITTGFQPDLVWIKRRNNVSDHQLYDSVRGVQKAIFSSLTNAEGTEGGTRGLNAFDSDGFTLGGEVADIAGSCNASGSTYASWNWLANDTASSNTDGSITSNVSANTTSGFSIVSYTGTGSLATVGHGLGVAPKMVIVKNLIDSEPWIVYHSGIDATAPQDYHLRLNTADAKVDEAAIWNDTAPTSSVFSLGSSGAPNGSGDATIAYCFADVKGYSKFGSYTGNGNTDGTFIYTGFKPAFVIRKRTDTTADWRIDDSKRDGYNVIPFTLFPNLNNEETTSSGYYVDLLSNGFKCRGTSVNQNASGGTYIYMAFAENPLVGTNNIPTTAR
jgi:hypothetical protein